jgi:rare lipoprotein A
MQVSRIAAAVALACSLTFVGGPSFGKTARVKVSWYGVGDGSGSKTASGKRFSASDPTIVAHKCLPFGTTVFFRNLENGKTLVAQVADRGPYVGGRAFDLTHGGATRLGILHSGVAVVEATWNVPPGRGCKT